MVRPTGKVNLSAAHTYPGKLIIIAYVLKVIPPGSGSEFTTGTVKKTRRRLARGGGHGWWRRFP